MKPSFRQSKYMNRIFLRYYLTLLLWLFVANTVSYANADSSTDALSLLSSHQLMERGRSFFEQRNADKALECFTIVSNRHKDTSDPDIMLGVRALNNIGCVYKYILFDDIKAYVYFTQAYDLCEEADDQEFLAAIMVNMGDLLNDYGINNSSPAMSQRAHKMFDHCWEQAWHSHNWELLMTVFFNLTNQNYDMPLQKYKRLFSKMIPDSTPDLQYVRLQYRGIEQLQHGNYSEARSLFEQQLPVVSARWEPERDTLATYMGIAYTYRMEGRYPDEIRYLEKALQFATDNHVSDQTTVIQRRLADARNRDLIERQHIQQLVIIFIGIVLLVVICSALLLWYKNRQLHARNKSLYEKSQQLLITEEETQQLRRKEFEESKYKSSSLSNEQRELLIFRIQEILNNPEAICQPDFNMGKLAKMADSNTTYASQVVNEKYGTAFSNVLSSYRIKEACRRMGDVGGAYGHMTIEAIAADVGFKSRTSFINAFKREVGLTPSEYLRAAQSL